MSAHNLVRMIRHASRLDHGIGVAAVDLDPDGSLAVGCLEFGVGLFSVTDQSFSRDEFGVDHVRPLLPAYPTE